MKDEYLALKAERARLAAEGRCTGDTRRSIARRFGRLLSYSDAHIDRLLAGR